MAVMIMIFKNTTTMLLQTSDFDRACPLFPHVAPSHSVLRPVAPLINNLPVIAVKQVVQRFYIFSTLLIRPTTKI